MKPAQALLVFSLCLPVDALLAEDFVFSIPLELRQLMPQVEHVMLECVVFNEDEDKIGGAYTLVTPKEGEYLGEAKVAFNADPGMDPNMAVNYRCFLRLRHVSGRRYIVPQFKEDESDWPVWAQARPGSELVYAIEDVIPGAGAAEPEKKK